MTFGQDPNKAIIGSIQIDAYSNNTPFALWSDDLIVMPDYESSTFRFIVHPENLETDDTIFENKTVLINPIQLETYLSIEHFPMGEHSQKQFTLSGNVGFNKMTPDFFGQGEMYHIDNAFIRSVMTMKFNVSPETLGLKDLIQGDTEATVQIRLPLPQE